MFDLDESLDLALQAVYSSDKYDKVRELLDNIVVLNNVLLNDVDLDIVEMVNELSETLATNEDDDSLADSFDNILYSYLIDYLREYGIYLNEDNNIGIVKLIDIVDVIKQLYSPDTSTLEAMIEDVDPTGKDDNEMHLADIIASRTTYRSTELVDDIDAVDPKFFTKLIVFYQKEMSRSTVKLDKEITDIIAGMSKIDNALLETNIIRSITMYGYNPARFEVMKDSLYKSISSIDKHSYRDIALEIAATIFIATDTRGKRVELSDDILNLSWADNLYPSTDNRAGSIVIKDEYNKLIDAMVSRIPVVTRNR